MFGEHFRETVRATVGWLWDAMMVFQRKHASRLKHTGGVPQRRSGSISGMIMDDGAFTTHSTWFTQRILFM